MTEAQQSPVKRFELRFWPQQNQEETKENSQTEKAFGGVGGGQRKPGKFKTRGVQAEGTSAKVEKAEPCRSSQNTVKPLSLP